MRHFLPVLLILSLDACGVSPQAQCATANSSSPGSGGCRDPKSVDSPRVEDHPAAQQQPASDSASDDAGATETSSGWNNMVDEKEQEIQKARDETQQTMDRATARANVQTENINENFNRLNSELNAAMVALQSGEQS